VTACEFCGNDDAAYKVCLSCLGTDEADLALALAIVLGGNSEDWHDVAHAMREALS
jgi:hypothetical protein